MPVVMQYGPHKITTNFDIATFYPEARSVSPVKDAPKNVHLSTLASTSPNAWGETNLDVLRQGQASFESQEDLAGRVPLVVLAEIDVPKAKRDKEEVKKPVGDDKEEAEKEAAGGGPVP